MSDEFTEVTVEGWGGRIMESIKGILVGIVMFFVAFPVLFMNEGCAVKRMKDLDQGKSECISVSSDKSDPANDGKLIHFSAEATTGDTVQDDLFKVKANCIRLDRDVKMYQWKETEKTKTEKQLGGKKKKVKTYSYNKGWHHGRIDSGDFKKSEGHQNPQPLCEPETFIADMVTAGAFQLSKPLIHKISGSSSVPLSDDILRSLPESLRKKDPKLQGNTIYIGNDPANPQVGDLKVTFRQVKPAIVSIYAKQAGTQLEKYPTESGGTLLRLEMGQKSKEEMFAAAEAESEMRTWLVRLGGFILMTMGIFLVVRPISVLGDVVPFIGSMVGGLLFVVAAAISFGLSLITISAAWLFYRPLIGIPLLVVGLGGIIFAIVILAGKKANKIPETRGDAF